MVAEVGNTRMCVQEASWGVLSWDDCRFSAVLRPNTEPIVTASGITTNDPCGSMATRQALRMEGESAAEMPHMRQTSFSCLLIVCREHSPSRILQSFVRSWFKEAETGLGKVRPHSPHLTPLCDGRISASLQVMQN